MENTTIPKKDQCNICVGYNRDVVNEKLAEKDRLQYKAHERRKKAAREEKEKLHCKFFK